MAPTRLRRKPNATERARSSRRRHGAMYSGNLLYIAIFGGRIIFICRAPSLPGLCPHREPWLGETMYWTRPTSQAQTTATGALAFGTGGGVGGLSGAQSAPQ